jgi:hypothetical protein
MHFAWRDFSAAGFSPEGFTVFVFVTVSVSVRVSAERIGDRFLTVR